MQCPNCALYHPSRYDRCVSCGTALVADSDMIPAPPSASSQMSRGIRQQPPLPRMARPQHQNEDDDEAPPARRGGGGGKLHTGMGIMIAGFILCASAGVTIFFLTKPPENQRLLSEGQKQLQLGQYAFALKTLQEAVKLKPDDPKALLGLARAYVGVDQVDKAWDSIVQAQQLGAGVMADPQLASDLANYYRQHAQYQRAVELLRPLATANVPGKKAELADLDASWGDQALQEGDVKQALRCWEEVREMREGSRYSEADSRLATIYQKVGEENLRKGDDDEALKYYSKLNVMAPSAASYERTADLYEKQGKLELAIDQLRKAIKLSSEPGIINRKLALLMSTRGKELLDHGDADAGYGFLQQAQTLDPKIRAPLATIRNVQFNAEGGIAHLTGEVWNPGPDQVNSLTLRGEVYDGKASRVVWSRDYHVIDEFVPPLAGREARSVDITTGGTADPNMSELRVYLNGSLYKTYKMGKGTIAKSGSSDLSVGVRPVLRPRIPAIAPANNNNNDMPPTAPDRVTTPNTAPDAAPNPGPDAAPPPGVSPEEKTLKDLD